MHMRAAVVAVLAAAACASPGEPPARPSKVPPQENVDVQQPASGVLDRDPPAGAGAMAPNLTPAGADEALLSWVEPDGKGMRVRFSRLAGMKWSEASTIASGERVLGGWADAPVVVTGAGGEMVAAWTEGAGGKGEVSDVVLGRKSGSGWKRLGAAHDDRTATEHAFASLLPDRGGILAVWLDGRATAKGEPMTLHSARIGPRGVEQPALVDARVCDCCPTAAAMTDRGPVVAYRDRDGKDVRDISVVRLVDGKWSVPVPVHADGWHVGGCPVSGPAIAASGRLVAVAWYSEAQERPAVRVAFSRDAGAHFGDPIEVDARAGGRTPLGRVSIALDDAGDALVTWVAARDRAAEIVVRRIAVDGAVGPERTVAATGAARSSGVPRALRVDEWLLVAWTDVEAHRIRATALALREIGAPAAVDSTPPQVPPADQMAAGRAAPTRWVGKNLEGRAVRIGDLRGKVVVLNLWATYCAPCFAEFPELAALKKTWRKRGVEFVSLSIDEDAARPRVIAVWKKHGLPYTLWLDPQETAPFAFATQSIPVTFVIDRLGVVRLRHDDKIRAGDHELNAAIEAALAAR
jgi:thiol-disulfide isomerase/thioredoxin